MALFFTSDLHLGHDREFIYKPRGFNSLYEMEEKIIENWNSKVTNEDDVIVLGDFALGNNYEGLDELIGRLNGRIFLLRGNHDTDHKMNYYKTNWHFMIKRIEHADDPIKYKKKTFMLSHYPMLTSNLESDPDECIINLHGHTHSKEKFYNDIPYMYNVACDAHNCTPVSIDEIITDIENKIEECKKFLV